jgi:hypothetical protein
VGAKTNPNTVFIAFALLLTALIASPFVEQLRAPLLPTGGPISSPGKYWWYPLSSEEALSLRLQIRNIPKREQFRIICTNSDCRELADSFARVFSGADWSPVSTYGDLFSSPVGIVLYQKDINEHALADAIEKATNGRLQVKITKSDDPIFDSLYVGLKP